MKETINFCIAADWEYDKDFIQLLEKSASNIGLTTYVVWPHNLDETYLKLKQGKIYIDFFFDRASDTSSEFLKLHQFLAQSQVKILDPVANITWAADKATMHLEFIAQGLLTPYTIIIPPFNTTEKILLSIADIARLGRPFIIKPANTTGGGIGVVEGAETLQDIFTTRQQFDNDKYLLQEKVLPLEKDEKRFWFRGFFCLGLTECCWWNDITHEYEILTAEQIGKYRLNSLFDIVKKIAVISKLNFFSSEIVLNQKEEFVVIDYVNEICDMRMKSNHFDGVPDSVVQKIANQIVLYIKNQISL